MTDRQTDRQTSCDNIVRAKHTHRALKNYTIRECDDTIVKFALLVFLRIIVLPFQNVNKVCVKALRASVA